MALVTTRALVLQAFPYSETSKILRLSADLPLVIEIVDRQERIDAFLPELDRMMGSGLVTLENVRIRQYGPSARADG